jgi:rRNA-processing protein FCF1
MGELLPATKALLLEVLDGLNASDSDLPELRVSGSGLKGARYWWHGPKRQAFEGRRPRAQFDELRSAGYLRHLRGGTAGDFYAFTPAAFRLRDEVLRKSSPRSEKVRPIEPPVELQDAKSMASRLATLALQAVESLKALAEVSEINVFRNDPNSGAFFVPMDPNSWGELPREYVPLLASVREHTEAWLVAARLAIGTVSPEHLDEFDEHADSLRRIYIRGSAAKGPSVGSTAQLIELVDSDVAAQRRLIDHLPGAIEASQTLIVPDTNALLQDPRIEDWVLGDSALTIVVPQQVVVELDKKKIEGNESVAKKADSLIKRFREYGRRGDTFAGVTLAGPRQFRELPMTPDMTAMPPSLDPEHADDRILASALYLAARHLSSRVVLVTRDRNLQNKARLVGLPAVDVADL